MVFAAALSCLRWDRQKSSTNAIGHEAKPPKTVVWSKKQRIRREKTTYSMSGIRGRQQGCIAVSRYGFK